jgi:hypothetical protein
MRRILCAALVWVGLIAAAHANNRNFTIVNATQVTINRVLLSSYGDSYWHAVQNLPPIPPGYIHNIVFYNSGPCQVQMKLELSDGTTARWSSGFNLCRYSAIRVWLDYNGVYQASYR